VFKQPETTAGAVLSAMVAVGALSTLIGGRMADSFGFHTMIRGGFLCLPPLLGMFVFTDSAPMATVLIILTGFTLYVPMSPRIVTGQKLLPNHIGLSSGVTIGLSVSVGGIAAPLLGWVADVHGLFF
jgi:FSR family fosmidomycin resistance protein-like MFS transporter